MGWVIWENRRHLQSTKWFSLFLDNALVNEIFKSIWLRFLTLSARLEYVRHPCSQFSRKILIEIRSVCSVLLISIRQSSSAMVADLSKESKDGLILRAIHKRVFRCKKYANNAHGPRWMQTFLPIKFAYSCGFLCASCQLQPTHIFWWVLYRTCVTFAVREDSIFVMTLLRISGFEQYKANTAIKCLLK